MKTAFAIFVAAILLTGCATKAPPPTPLTQADIISMVKVGVTDEEIMKRIDVTQSVFRLGSDDVTLLRKEGVSDRVVNYMLDSWTRAAVAAQRRQDANKPSVSFGLGYIGN